MALDAAKGWQVETRGGATRLGAWFTPDGRRAAFLRAPAERATVILLTNDDTVDARALAHRIMDRVLSGN